MTFALTLDQWAATATAVNGVGLVIATALLVFIGRKQWLVMQDQLLKMGEHADELRKLATQTQIIAGAAKESADTASRTFAAFLRPRLHASGATLRLHSNQTQQRDACYAYIKMELNMDSSIEITHARVAVDFDPPLHDAPPPWAASFEPTTFPIAVFLKTAFTILHIFPMPDRTDLLRIAPNNTTYQMSVYGIVEYTETTTDTSYWTPFGGGAFADHAIFPQPARRMAVCVVQDSTVTEGRPAELFDRAYATIYRINPQ